MQQEDIPPLRLKVPAAMRHKEYRSAPRSLRLGAERLPLAGAYNAFHASQLVGRSLAGYPELLVRGDHGHENRRDNPARLGSAVLLLVKLDPQMPQLRADGISHKRRVFAYAAREHELIQPAEFGIERADLLYYAAYKSIDSEPCPLVSALRRHRETRFPML